MEWGGLDVENNQAMLFDRWLTRQRTGMGAQSDGMAFCAQSRRETRDERTGSRDDQNLHRQPIVRQIPA